MPFICSQKTIHFAQKNDNTTKSSEFFQFPEQFIS
uniref:Uncharacterized protein n=1 Tax=Lepeophtheirus salmonis TaxID=72036 RepID=A0A0K2T4N7_LEPSM